MTQDHADERGGKPRRSNTSFPEDRFDRVQQTRRVGAHRVNARPSFFWQYVIAIVLGTAILTTVGIIAVTSLNSQGKLPTTRQSGLTAASPARVKPVLDPDATVVLLDGTTPDGDIAVALDPVITEQAWGTVVSAGPATSSDIEISGVFYSNPADEASALGLAEKLGGLSAYQNTDYEGYGAQLVVLIGFDYAGPGADATRDSPAEG